MNKATTLRKAIVLAWGTVLLALAASARAEDVPLQPGDSAALRGRTARLLKLDTLPLVESEFTKRFKFDVCDNAKLKELRERYGLAQVVAPGQDEFDRQVRLMDWAHRQFKKFGRPSTSARGALDILRGIAEGNTFFCAQYAELLVSSAASLGWVDRPLALRRHQGVAAVGGSTEHSVTEIWSNQHRKWVMLDPTLNLFVEKEGVPLNAYEIRQEWFYRDGTNLVFVISQARNKYRKSDLPVMLEYFPDFGNLALYPDELDKYGFIAYIPNTDLMDSGFDYAQMFIVKDRLCDGTRWHVRTLPAHPATDPYFPMGQAALSLRADGDKLTVALRTFTPNFERYEARLDGGVWSPAKSDFAWSLHPGVNRLEARTINRFGVSGPIAVADVDVKE